MLCDCPHITISRVIISWNGKVPILLLLLLKNSHSKQLEHANLASRHIPVLCMCLGLLLHRNGLPLVVAQLQVTHVQTSCIEMIHP